GAGGRGQRQPAAACDECVRRPTLSLNAREVEEILKALEASSFDSLDLEIGGVKLSLRRSGTAPSPPRAAAGTNRAAAAPTPAVPPGTHAVPAPLLGVFYRAPKPGEP